MFHHDLAKRIADAQTINDRHTSDNPADVVTARNDLASRLSAGSRPATPPERTSRANTKKVPVPADRAAIVAAAAIEAVANHLD